MCGIHGIYRLDSASVDPAHLRLMGEATQHRGPDDAGAHVDQRCGIAMRRLSIIDLAGGHQPIANADETLWLVCNGEIYNFRELREELEAQGYTFKTHSDSEVVLHLYDLMGDEFVHRLNGMFDFALWDARRQRLLIGRDRLGVKPLYVYQDAEQIAFATEAKAFFSLPGVDAEIDRGVVREYLQLGYVPAPATLFKRVRKLPPATLLAIEDGKCSEWRYWRLSPKVEAKRSEKEWVDLVRAQLEESVRMQMVSDVPIGAFLSGGVDSSAVVAFMARHSEHPVRTYAIGFEGGEAEKLYNELPYARRVAELFATEHHEIVVKPDVVGLLPKLIWHMDEPVADTAFITTYLVSQYARQDVKVILSGVGGDELFGGYRRYLGGHYAERFRRVPSPFRRLARWVANRLPSDRHSGMLNMLRLAKGFLASADMSPDARYRSYLQVLDDATVSGLMVSPDGEGDSLGAAFRQAGNDDELNRMLAVDAETQLPDDLLLLTDKMSMAVSLECRVPLLDHTLVELAASIPAAQKLPKGRLKHLLKESLKDLLPDDILNRKKRGFGTPMGAWLKQELAPMMRQLLSKETIERRGLFRYEAVAELMDAHTANRIDATDGLLALVNLEVWSRIFLDRRDPEDVAVELKTFL